MESLRQWERVNACIDVISHLLQDAQCDRKLDHFSARGGAGQEKRICPKRTPPKGDGVNIRWNR
jgi:hypothetical protein